MPENDKIMLFQKTTPHFSALTVTPQTTREELRQEHVNKSVANFTRRLTAYMAMTMTSVVIASICSNSVHLQVCILISSPTHGLFSETPTDYQWRQCSECWEMVWCLGWNHIFVSFSHMFQQKPGDRLYILLFNSFVKFRANMFMHWWNINKSLQYNRQWVNLAVLASMWAQQNAAKIVLTVTNWHAWCIVQEWKKHNDESGHMNLVGSLQWLTSMRSMLLRNISSSMCEQ